MATSVGSQPNALSTAILELDLDAPGMSVLVDLDPIAGDVRGSSWAWRISPENSNPGFDAPAIKRSMLGAIRPCQRIPPKFAHRAIIGKITRSGRYRSGQTGLTVDQLA